MDTEPTQDQEFNAIVLEMKRAQRTNYIKFGAFVILTFIGFFAVTYLAMSVPALILGG